MYQDGSSQRLITREESVLLLIDVQEKLLPAVADGKALLDNVLRLVKFARIIGLPVVVTEQMKLGDTVPEVRAEIPDMSPIRKLTFDCFGTPEFTSRIRDMNRPNLILAGVEAHICVVQTAVSALRHYNVHTVVDAVSSRSPHNKAIALERMAQAGATLTSTETVIYELLGEAGTDEFKAVLPLVK